MSNKKTKLTAITLRKLLLIAIFLIISLSAVGFYFAQDILGKYAAEADQTTSGGSASGSNSQTLSKIREEIANNQSAGAKAGSLISSSQNYQNQIIKDINAYVATNSITITGYNLTQSAPSGASNSTPISGIKSSYVTVSISSPVSIRSLLQFIKSIETNLPKMQITGINLSSGGSVDKVKVDPLTIEVYTK